MTPWSTVTCPTDGTALPVFPHYCLKMIPPSRSGTWTSGAGWCSSTASERPSFLFASWEHDLQPAVSLNTLQVLSADREALRLQLLERDGEIDALRNELVDATRKLASMALSTEEALRPRSEGTYLNIVGGLLGLLLGKSPAGKPFSSFGTTESIVSALLAHHSGRPGMSERTLRAKFAAAKRHLDA